MTKIFSKHWPFIGLLILLSIFYFWGIVTVPFHPDESTYIRMSQDFETLFNNPRSMAWQPDIPQTSEMRYRMIDAPVTRYLIGLGRMLGGQPNLLSDWDWGKTWVENSSAGALPSRELLFLARFSITLLFPITMVFMYCIGLNWGGRGMGWLASALLGMNALTLLHARRAMAEGATLFGIVFFVWSLNYAKRFPWLIGFAMAMAVNAKYSALALVPIGLIAVSWLPRGGRKRATSFAANMLQFALMFGVMTISLNPFLWRQPLQALEVSWTARQELIQRQYADVQGLAPEKALRTLSQRTLSLVANLYITPPSFAEIGNYVDETSVDEAVYLSIPGHNLGRNLIAGGILLALTGLGVLLAVYRTIWTHYKQKQFSVLLLTAAAFQLTALLVAVPLPWQRYSIPLLPFVCLFAAYGLQPFINGKSL